jgi:hypothetical protein
MTAVQAGAKLDMQNELTILREALSLLSARTEDRNWCIGAGYRPPGLIGATDPQPTMIRERIDAAWRNLGEALAILLDY